MYDISKGYSEKENDYTVVKITGAKHMNFSDINSLIPVLGKLTGFLGEIKPQRQTEIMNACIVGFFDSHLKGIPLNLEQLESVYPEVNVEHK